MPDVSVEVMPNLSLNRGEFPSDDELRQVAANLSGSQTILSERPLERYSEVVRLYPYNPEISEYREIAEAAAIGDPVALCLEWIAMRNEAYFESGTPEPDQQSDREKAVDEWQKYKEAWLDPQERREHGSIPEDEVLEILDDSIALIEGALAVARMKMAEPIEPDAE